MNALIIPAEKLSFFDRSIEGQPNIRSGPVKIHTGAQAGSYAINEAIFASCAEWEAAEPDWLAMMAEHGIQVAEIDPAVLRNPSLPTGF